jgi:hypothetical protein
MIPSTEGKILNVKSQIQNRLLTVLKGNQI